VISGSRNPDIAKRTRSFAPFRNRNAFRTLTSIINLRETIMAMKTTTLAGGAVSLLEPKGSLIGGDETDELRAAVTDLFEQGNRKLVIDLSKVTYLNSTAIGVLVHAHTTYSRNGGIVKLCGINKNINNIFVVSKLTMVFDVCETRDEAVSSFS
jgi:anti-anti-sigma factor